MLFLTTIIIVDPFFEGHQTFFTFIHTTLFQICLNIQLLIRHGHMLGRNGYYRLYTMGWVEIFTVKSIFVNIIFCKIDIIRDVPIKKKIETSYNS